MSFALLKLVKREKKLNSGSDRSNLREKYRILSLSSKVSAKVLQVAAATMVFASVAANAPAVQAQEMQASLPTNVSKIINVVEPVKKINYTGLVVMFNGSFDTVMSPKIISESGTAVYGVFGELTTEQTDFVVNEGIAGFPETIAKSTSRSGERPLIVEAKQIDGDTVIISDADALKIITENSSTHFLDNFKVSFVPD